MYFRPRHVLLVLFSLFIVTPTTLGFPSLDFRSRERLNTNQLEALRIRSQDGHASSWKRCVSSAVVPEDFDYCFSEYGATPTLEKRVMTTPEPNVPPKSKNRVNKWILRELKAIEDSQDGPSIWRDAQDNDVNTGFYKDIGDEAFSIGTGYLSGCTCMVIHTHEGVYFGH